MFLILIMMICFFKISIAVAPNVIDKIVINNVGQGQWVYHVTNTTCNHFDFGGELFKINLLKKNYIANCSKKINRLHLSHSDYDHYSYFKQIQQTSKNVCWSYKPADFKKDMNLIPYCLDSDINTSQYQLLGSSPFSKNKNQQSSFYLLKTLLLSGDAHKKNELKLLNFNENKLKNVKILMLGHHGSKTSTDAQFVKSMIHLKLAIASARSKKYGHPHKETESTLMNQFIPLLKTEDWGTITLY